MVAKVDKQNTACRLSVFYASYLNELNLCLFFYYFWIVQKSTVGKTNRIETFFIHN
jgi:hypothetical protein